MFFAIVVKTRDILNFDDAKSGLPIRHVARGFAQGGGGGGLRGPRVTPLQNQKPLGFGPLFFGKGPILQTKNNKAFKIKFKPGPHPDS